MEHLQASFWQFVVAVAAGGSFFLAAHLILAIGHRMFGRSITTAARPFRTLDSWLARDVAGWVGLNQSAALSRWGRMLALFLGVALLGSFLPIWLAAPVLTTGLVAVAAVFRRWSWDEEDRAVGLPPQAKRVQGLEDYNDELLAALAAVFTFGALLTWRIGGALPLFGDIGQVGLIGYVAYVAGEAIEAIPIVGNVDVIGWRNPSGLELHLPYGGYFAFALRTALDLLVIGGLLKAAEIAGRISRGEDLRRFEAAALLDDDKRAWPALNALADLVKRGSAPASELLSRIAMVPASGDAAPWRVRFRSADTLQRLGLDETGSTHLTAAVQGWRGLVEEAREKTPGSNRLGVSLNRLGVSAGQLGMRRGGLDGLDLLREAASAYEEALEVFEEKQMPLKAWEARANLGTALLRIGQRAGHVGARDALEQSVRHHQVWMDERGVDASPANRATMLHNFGLALQLLAGASPDGQALTLLDQSIGLFRQALDEEFDDVGLRGNLDSHLSITLERRARLQGEGAADSAREAVQRLEEAVRQAEANKDLSSLASRLVSLGISQQRLGQNTDGQDGLDLLILATRTLQRGVGLCEDLGMEDGAANARDALGVALDVAARQSSDEQAQELWTAALATYDKALEVLSPDDHPRDWARCLQNLAVTYWAMGIALPNAEGVDKLEKAVATGRKARESRSRHSSDWLVTSKNLAVALADLALRRTFPDNRALFEEAIDIYRQCLLGLDPGSNPLEWSSCKVSLAVAMRDMTERLPHGNKAGLYVEAIDVFREALTVLTPGVSKADWANLRFNLGIALDRLALTLGPDSGVNHAREAVSHMEAALEVWTLEIFPRRHLEASQWLAFSLGRLATMDPAGIDSAMLKRASALYEYKSDLQRDSNYPVERVWFDSMLARAAVAGED